MRETIKDQGRIIHMLEAATIIRDKAPSYSLSNIRNDRILFFGLAKLIEIIGDAAYKLTLEFKESHPELPWKVIIGMRHVMVHGYYTISPDQIWATINTDIIEIIPTLEKYIQEFENLND